MLSNLLSYFSFSNTHYDSYMLLFWSLMLQCIHIVPEDPDVVGSFTGRPNPSLPRTIGSIQSCEPLGEIEFGITEEDGVWHGIRRVRDLVAEAYKASSTSTGDVLTFPASPLRGQEFGSRPLYRRWLHGAKPMAHPVVATPYYIHARYYSPTPVAQVAPGPLRASRIRAPRPNANRMMTRR